MYAKVQAAGTLAPKATSTWGSYGWDTSAAVVWTVVPTSPIAGTPQIRSSVAVEGPTAGQLNYYVTVYNLTDQKVSVEIRVTVLN